MPKDSNQNLNKLEARIHSPVVEAEQNDNPRSILEARLRKVTEGELINGHHPEQWVRQVLEGSAPADDRFLARYFEEYRWVGALFVDTLESKEDAESLFLAIDDALLEAAFKFGDIAEDERSDNFVQYISNYTKQYLEELFNIPDIQNPYDNPEIKKRYTPNAEIKVGERFIESRFLPGLRQPEDVEIGSKMLYQATVSERGDTQILLGEVLKSKRYENRQGEQELLPGDNPSPGYLRMKFDPGNPFHPHSAVADVNSCYIVPLETAGILADSEDQQRRWFTEGKPGVSASKPPEQFIEDVKVFVNKNRLLVEGVSQPSSSVKKKIGPIALRRYDLEGY